MTDTVEPAVAPAPVMSKRPAWSIPALVIATFAVIATGAVIATKSTTPQPATPTGAEQSYLRLVHANPNDEADTKALLSLGHGACKTMSSGTAGYSEYRIAVGQLMAAQESPRQANLIVHSALTSGLCTERQS
jgi:hypothetical protein